MFEVSIFSNRTLVTFTMKLMTCFRTDWFMESIGLAKLSSDNYIQPELRPNIFSCFHCSQSQCISRLSFLGSHPLLMQEKWATWIESVNSKSSTEIWGTNHRTLTSQANYLQNGISYEVKLNKLGEFKDNQGF